MNDKIANLTQSFLRRFGIELHYQYPSDFTQEEIEIIKSVKDYTLTIARRIKALINSVHYIVDNKIEGSIVECGVWKGGSIMAAAKTLMSLNNFDRNLYLFDTFEGMTDPTDFDISVRNEKAFEVMQKAKVKGDELTLSIVSLDQVKKAVFSTGYPKEKFHLIKGKVEDTLQKQAPQKISLLRLDTDWYESTKNELIYLFPRLAKGGVLIIDDYGYWTGSKKAVDEYFNEKNIPFLINRIDSSGRIGVKITD